ncbi:MAG: VWA domain-containing protein [Pseudomonadales bacterium]
MLLRFFLHLRKHRLPVSLRELLDFLAALKARLVFADLDRFYYLSRLCLVKDEKYFDRFDLAFNSYFKSLDGWNPVFETPDSVALLKTLLVQIFPTISQRDLDAALAEYRQTLLEQNSETQAGKRLAPSKSGDEEAANELPANEKASSEDKRDEMSEEFLERDMGKQGDAKSEADDEEGESLEEGDSGESGEGDEGEEGEGDDGEKGEGKDGKKGEGSGNKPGMGVRTDLASISQRSALKVWQLREFQDYDPDVELGTRNIKLALRRLRKFSRTAAEFELDLEDTIRTTAKNGGLLEIIEVPERRNAVKVLLFLDVGGSMDDHIEMCAQLFSAARSEFKYLEFFYFHNFVYESVWTENNRRGEDKVSTLDILRKYGRDYKVIFVGDAQMGRHEIMERGGSVEHYNAETGEVWMMQMLEQFRKIVWLNPANPAEWKDSYTTKLVARIMDDKMYHLSVAGIESAMKYLVR